jgi:hypothetical protein
MSCAKAYCCARVEIPIFLVPAPGTNLEMQYLNAVDADEVDLRELQ